MSSSRVPGRRPYHHRRIHESTRTAAPGARPLSNLLSQIQDFSIDGDEIGPNPSTNEPIGLGRNNSSHSRTADSSPNVPTPSSGGSGAPPRSRYQPHPKGGNSGSSTPVIPEEESGAPAEDEGWLFNDPDGAGALADLLSKSKKNRTDGRAAALSRRRRAPGESGRNAPSTASSSHSHHHDIKFDHIPETNTSSDTNGRFDTSPAHSKPTSGRNSPALSSGPPSGIPTRTHPPNISRQGTRLGAPSPSRSTTADSISVRSGGYAPSTSSAKARLERSQSRSRDPIQRNLTATPRLKGQDESLEGAPSFGMNGSNTNVLQDRVQTESPTSSSRRHHVPREEESDDERPQQPFSPSSMQQKWTQAISQFKITPLFSASSTENRYGARGMIRRGSAQTSQSALSGIVDLSDTATVTRLVDDAMKDCEGFSALDPEKYNEKKRELVFLTTQVTSLQNKICLETKMRESAESMLQLNPSPMDTSRAQRQISESNKKIEDMAASMWTSLFQLLQTERTVFQHIGGILRWQVDELQNQFSSAPTIKVAPSRANESDQKLRASEARVRELENQIFVLQSNVSRLEAEQEPIRRIAGDYQKEARRAREDRDAYESHVKSSEPSKTNVIEVNRLKLELASSRAELSSVTEELGATRDSLAALQLQLQEDQSVIEEKDRTIANLLGDLEEKDNQLEMIQAGAHVPFDTLSRSQQGSLSRMMKHKRGDEGSDKNRANMLAAQLKEAVLEREKLKFDLDQERERTTELEARLDEMQSVSTSSHRNQSSKSGFSRRMGSSTAGPKSGSDTETEGEDQGAAGYRYGAPGGNGKRRPSQQSHGRGSDAALEQERQRIKELELKLSEIREKTLSEEDELMMRDLFEGIHSLLKDRSAYQRRTPTFSIPVFLAKIEELFTRTQDLLEEQVNSYGNMSRNQNEKAADEELKRQIRVLEEQLVALETDMRQQKSDFDRQRKQIVEETESQYNRKMDRLKEDHRFEIEQLKSSVDRDRDELEFMLKREAENTRAVVEREWEIKQRDVLDDMKRQYESEFTEMQTSHQRDMEKLQRDQKDKIAEIMRKLENSENALLTSKQSYFSERERLQEAIDDHQNEIRTLKHQLSDKDAELDKARRDFESKQEMLNVDIDKYERQLTEAHRDLEDKNREIQRVTDRLTNDIAEQKLVYDKKISELQSQVSEYQSIAAELEAIEKEFNVKLKAKEDETEDLTKQLREERFRAQQAIDESKEAQAYASDQLQRVQRLLAEAERDIDRYRRLSDEKDTEILDLKRALRQKDKEMSSMMASGEMDSSSSMRRLLDQKDRDLEAARSEIRAAMADISALKRRVEMKDREIEDAKNEMARRSNMKNKDEAMEEVERLQLIILDLKTARVGLLEDLDDAQHNEQILKTEVASLKNEIERLKSAAR